ncbi:putative taurine catabolism dioxygenase [Frankia sp. QA3]|nr:putative taurine catabolism dioxygenase [Frankia sp. QA3]
MPPADPPAPPGTSGGAGGGFRAGDRRYPSQHGVLVWRDQQMDTAGQVAFAEAFGPILAFTSVVDPEPARPGVHELHGGNVGWHFDASSLPAPPEATVLRAVRVPPVGGDTLWASGVAAYQALTPDLRALATGRYVTHGRGVTRAPDDERPIVAHPLVRRHPHTGDHDRDARHLVRICLAALHP